jgi:mRNA interferase MazF
VICNAFDITLVPFPFVERPASKIRPALVVSCTEFNAANGHSVMAMITTASKTIWPDDHMILNPQVAGLVRNCYVRWKIFTLPNEMIVRRIGRIGDDDRISLIKKVQAVFAWA